MTHGGEPAFGSSLAAFQDRYPAAAFVSQAGEWAFRDTDPGSSRTPVVMLPGAGGTGDVFYHAVEALAPRRRVVTLAYPAQSVPERLAAGLVELLDELQLEQVDLCGSSFGGYLAQALALERPERVARAMFCNTFFNASWLQAKVSRDSVLATPPEDHLANTRRQLRGLPEETPEQADFKATMLSLVGREQTAEAARATLLAVLAAVPLERVPLPAERIAILDAEDDATVDAPTRAAMRRRYAQSRQHPLGSGGHYPALLNPREFIGSLLAVLGAPWGA